MLTGLKFSLGLSFLSVCFCLSLSLYVLIYLSNCPSLFTYQSVSLSLSLLCLFPSKYHFLDYIRALYIYSTLISPSFFPSLSPLFHSRCHFVDYKSALHAHTSANPKIHKCKHILTCTHSCTYIYKHTNTHTYLCIQKTHRQVNI